MGWILYNKSGDSNYIFFGWVICIMRSKCFKLSISFNFLSMWVKYKFYFINEEIRVERINSLFMS